jgi:hypothetical protein
MTRWILPALSLVICAVIIAFALQELRNTQIRKIVEIGQAAEREWTR